MAVEAKETSAKMTEHNGCCCHCNKLMALAIILLTWIPGLVIGQLWVKIVITILAILMGMSHSQCMMCKMKNK